mgnify:FL=1
MDKNYVVIDDVKYIIPSWIGEHNSKAPDFYKVLNIVEIFAGKENFDYIESQNGNYLDSECFAVFAEEMGINEDDALINEVSDAMFAYVTDYDEEDFTMVMLRKES